MSSINPHYRSIKELLQARSFSIDEYQREFKWDQQNIEELLADLLTAFHASHQPGDTPRHVSEYGEYFLGSIIVTTRGNRSFLVDGQQRTTSLTLLLINLYHLARKQKLAVATTISPLIYSDSYGEKSFNIDIAERLPVLRALFEGEDFNVDGQPESVRNMYARYKDIEHAELDEVLGDALPIFIYWLMEKVGLIEIETDSDKSAYLIFETMNDRGKPLSPVDMLKAFLLAPVEDSEERRIANSSWKNTVLDLISWGDEPNLERDVIFMKAWLRARYATSTRERRRGAVDRDWELIGSTFHRWFREQADAIGVGDAGQNYRMITNEIPFFARAYLRILDASRTFTPGLESVYYNAHNDFTWQTTVLLAPLNVRDDDETVRRKIAATSTYLDIWIMRRVSNYIRVSYSTVSYAMYLLVKDIRSLELDELIDVLRSKLDDDSTEIDFDGAPGKGRQGIQDLRLNQFSTRYIIHLLGRISAFVERESGRNDRFPEFVDRSSRNSMDLEHIWAVHHDPYKNDFPTEDEFVSWRNNVAGLLLLPADVNRSYQDKPYGDKVGHYAKQNLWAASLSSLTYDHQPQFLAFIHRSGLPFRPYESFGRQEQIERSELILELVKLVWSPKRLDRYRA